MSYFRKIHLVNIFILTFSAFFFSCSSEDTEPTACSVQWATELQDEINALQQAAITHGQTQTNASCENLRTAARAYLDALRPYGSCQALTGQSRTDWQNAVAEAEQQIDDLDCEIEA
ncbi:hypothetical protein SAMN04488057_104408 [Cyclobacterium lianum]|uniref:Uncharacterized protein n=1 Tax=Cyclobacterium lianum TaxID=388280 RepID=A0A1M7MNV5_9BACT|nr:hypothetical protein [Cyclobacterium lianum]SHM92685.1 hypothetical protein SAMN04488057_104408 [Cyclobacterium lianum]